MKVVKVMLNFVYSVFFKCIQGYVLADFLEISVGGHFVSLSYLWYLF